MTAKLLQHRDGANTEVGHSFFHSPTSVFLAAFLVRAVYWWWRTYASGTFTEDVHNTMGNEAWNIASSIVAGKGYSSPFGADTGPTAWITPVYPYLLAGVLRIFGVASSQSVAAAAGLNELLSALTCVPIFFIGKRLGGRHLGVAAASLWVVHPLSISIAYEWLWYTSLSTFLIAWILYASMELPESGRLFHWIAYGLLWGVSLLTNASVLALAPFVFAWLIWRRKKHDAHPALLPAWAALAAVLVCSPWVIRNYKEFHQLLPLRSNFGFELWIGNPSGPVDTLADVDLLERLGEIRYSQERGQEAIRFLASHPRTALRLTWERFLLTWTGHEHPIWRLMRKGKSPNIEIVLFTCFSVLALIGGVYLFRAKSEFRWLLVFHPVVFPIVYYVTHTGPQYRLPIDPVLVVLVAVALAGLSHLFVLRSPDLRGVCSEKDSC